MEELYLPSTTPNALKQVLFGVRWYCDVYIILEYANLFILKLLEEDPAKRLNFESLKQQEWFAGLSWEDMENKRVTPPFQPDQVSIISVVCLGSTRSRNLFFNLKILF